MKNDLLETTRIVTGQVIDDNWDGKWNLYLRTNSITQHPTELYFIQPTEPTSVASTLLWYNPETNIIKYKSNGEWNDVQCVYLGGLTIDILNSPYRFTNISLKKVFQLVDYNDFQKADEQNVKLTGNQTISGNKTFNNSIHHNINDKTSRYGNITTATITNYDYVSDTPIDLSRNISMRDKNNHTIGYLSFFTSANGYNRTSLFANNYNGSTEVNGAMLIEANKDGTIKTWVPTPPDNDNGGQITTTKWIRNHTSMPSGKYIEVETGNSGFTYTAPVDGFICVGAISSNTNVSHIGIDILSSSNSFLYNVGGSYNLAQTYWFLVPVKKNNIIRTNYINFVIERFRFIYAEIDSY